MNDDKKNEIMYNLKALSESWIDNNKKRIGDVNDFYVVFSNNNGEEYLKTGPFNNSDDISESMFEHIYDDDTYNISLYCENINIGKLIVNKC